MKLPEACYKAAFSPYKRLSMLKPEEIKSTMRSAFIRWGLPHRIKIDNGYPFKPIRSKELPSLSMLWWAGLGIDPTLNSLATPQENGMVEGLHNITFRWVNPQLYDQPDQLQAALDEVCRQQRETYRIRAKGDKTRKELYPELEQNSRKYHDDLFDLSKVKDYLAKFVFVRKVSSNRNITFAGVKIAVRQSRKYPYMSLTYQPEKELWQIRTPQGELIKESGKPRITEDKILNFIPLSKNL